MPVLLFLLTASATASDCDDFIAGLAAATDDAPEWVFAPAPTCQAAIDEHLIDVDAVLRTLPVHAQAAAVCRLGTPAIDELRHNFVDDAALTVRERGRCLATLLPRQPQLLTTRGLLHDDDGRARVSPVALVAARTAPRALFAPLLQQAVRERARDRWMLGSALCGDHQPAALLDPCRHVKDDEDRAAEDAAHVVYFVGVPVVSVVGLFAAAAYVVAAAYVYGDTFVSVAVGGIGGVFAGGVAGAAAGFAVGALVDDDSVVERDVDKGTNGLAFVVGVVVGGGVGGFVGGAAGGAAAFFEGIPRASTFVAGTIGVGATVGAVGGLIVVAIAAEVDAVE